MKWAGRFPRRLRLIFALAAFLTGSAYGSWRGGILSEYFAYGIVSALGVFLVFRAYWLGIMGLSVSLALVGYVLAARGYDRVTIKETYRYSGQVQIISVRYVEAPRQRVTLRMLEGVKKGLSFHLYTYDWWDDPGEVLTVTAQVEPAKFGWQKGQGVIGTSNKLDGVQEITSPSGIFRLRAQLQARIGATLPEPYASLAVGLLTGVNDNFDTDFKDDLSRTGTSHVVAVSGANLTIVAMILQRLGQRKSRIMGFIFAVSGVLFYVLMAGANPSIVRGALMTTLYLTALLLGRPTHRVPMLLIVASLLTLMMPLGMLYSLSWQLSFLSFCGILFLSSFITPPLERWMGQFGATLGETTSAQILVLPLTLWQFQTVSVISLAVNGAVLLITPLAMAMSALQAVAALVSIQLGEIVAWLTYPVLWLIVRPIQWSSTLPFAAYEVTSFSLPYFVVSYGGIGVAFLLATWWRARRDKAVA